MPFIRVRGIKVHYHEEGSGQPVVLVHGITSNLYSFASFARALASDYRVISYDLRGHGLSEIKEPSGLDDLTADLAELLFDLRLRKPHLLGISLGGVIALRFALQRPERIRSLMLADTFPGTIDPAVLAGFVNHARMGLTQGMEALFNHVLEHPTLPIGPSLDLSPETFALHKNEFMKNNPRTIAAFVAIMEKLPDLRPQLPRLTLPTLLFAGDLDTPSIEPMREMSRLIPGSEFHLIPACGHTSTAEKPAESASLVKNFLAGRFGA